jgi:hypothetical protein
MIFAINPYAPDIAASTRFTSSLVNTVGNLSGRLALSIWPKSPNSI